MYLAEMMDKILLKEQPDPDKDVVILPAGIHKWIDIPLVMPRTDWDQIYVGHRASEPDIEPIARAISTGEDKEFLRTFANIETVQNRYTELRTEYEKTFASDLDSEADILSDRGSDEKPEEEADSKEDAGAGKTGSIRDALGTLNSMITRVDDEGTSEGSGEPEQLSPDNEPSMTQSEEEHAEQTVEQEDDDPLASLFGGAFDTSANGEKATLSEEDKRFLFNRPADNGLGETASDEKVTLSEEDQHLLLNRTGDSEQSSEDARLDDLFGGITPPEHDDSEEETEAGASGEQEESAHISSLDSFEGPSVYAGDDNIEGVESLAPPSEESGAGDIGGLSLPEDDSDLPSVREVPEEKEAPSEPVEQVSEPVEETPAQVAEKIPEQPVEEIPAPVEEIPAPVAEPAQEEPVISGVSYAVRQEINDIITRARSENCITMTGMEDDSISPCVMAFQGMYVDFKEVLREVDIVDVYDGNSITAEDFAAGLRHIRSEFASIRAERLSTNDGFMSELVDTFIDAMERMSRGETDEAVELAMYFSRLIYEED